MRKFEITYCTENGNPMMETFTGDMLFQTESYTNILGPGEIFYNRKIIVSIPTDLIYKIEEV